MSRNVVILYLLFTGLIVWARAVAIAQQNKPGGDPKPQAVQSKVAAPHAKQSRDTAARNELLEKLVREGKAIADAQSDDVDAALVASALDTLSRVQKESLQLLDSYRRVLRDTNAGPLDANSQLIS